MKNQVLILVALALAAAGCVVVDSGTRSEQSTASYGSSDEPFPVLNAYGNWIDVGVYGRVWQPAVMSDWRPYTNGQWIWTDRGWMFDSDEPFGWVVYHYGYWTQMDALGWVWVPGNDWSPARVDWYSGDGFVGWAPMCPPQARYPEAYQPGYENYWTVVPTPQFTRLNVGAYRTTAPPPRTPPPAAARGKASQRPPDIITIQGATHELIPAKKTEQDQVRVGRRTLPRVRVEQDQRPAPTPVYGSPSVPEPRQPVNPPVVLPNEGVRSPRPNAPPPIKPPPVQERTPSPVRVTPVPAPDKSTPAPEPVRTRPAPEPVRVRPEPAPNRPAPAPVTVTPAPAPPRVTVPDRTQERKEVKREATPETKKQGREK